MQWIYKSLKPPPRNNRKVRDTQVLHGTVLGHHHWRNRGKVLALPGGQTQNWKKHSTDETTYFKKLFPSCTAIRRWDWLLNNIAFPGGCLLAQPLIPHIKPTYREKSLGRGWVRVLSLWSTAGHHWWHYIHTDVPKVRQHPHAAPFWILNN